MNHPSLCAILCFHRVLPTARQTGADAPYFQRQTALGLDRFTALLDELSRRDAVRSPRALLDWNRARARRPGVILTFDDAYADVIELAAPELAARGMEALLCVTTKVASGGQRGFPVDHWYAAVQAATVRSGTLDGIVTDPWAFDLDRAEDRARLVDGPEKRAFIRASPDVQQRLLARLHRALGVESTPPVPAHLTATDLGKLVAAGWMLGSHGERHQLLPLLSDAEAEEDLVRSRAFFPAHGLPVPSIVAYPDGATDARIQDLARRAGYTIGLALGSRFATAEDPPLALPRLIPTNDPAWFERRLLPLFSTGGR